MLAFLACAGLQAAEWTPLRSLAGKNHIQVGAAVKYQAFQSDPTYRAMLLREYNLLVPENELKWSTLRPEAKSFAFEKADAVVNFAVTNGLSMRGHTLCWNADRYLPNWVLDQIRTPEQARKLLETHIRTVVTHYQGRIKCWDVVNEAVANRTNGPVLVDGFWKKMLGDEYIELAFKWAHEADPEAELFYNDYDKGDSMGMKSDRIYNLIKKLVEQKVPINGVGLQMHCSLANPPAEAAVRANIERLTRLGLKVQITEMDVDIDDVKGTLAERLEQQGRVYGIVARAAMSNPDCTAFVTWGVSDRWGNTNRNKLKGKPENSPTFLLPFDADYQPKPAAFCIAEAVRGSLPKRALAQTVSR